MEREIGGCRNHVDPRSKYGILPFLGLCKKKANVFDIYILETIHFILGSHTLIDIFDDKCTDDVNR